MPLPRRPLAGPVRRLEPLAASGYASAVPMRTLQISVAITCALALGGCLDNNSGPHDQWMNTDAYVAPPDAAIGDGGTVTPTCGDAGPAFTAPTQVSVDPGADAGVTAVQSDVALVALASGQRLLAWVDRSLATAGSASLVVGRVSAGAAPGTTTAITGVPTASAAIKEDRQGCLSRT